MTCGCTCSGSTPGALRKGSQRYVPMTCGCTCSSSTPGALRKGSRRYVPMTCGCTCSGSTPDALRKGSQRYVPMTCGCACSGAAARDSSATQRQHAWRMSSPPRPRNCCRARSLPTSSRTARHTSSDIALPAFLPDEIKVFSCMDEINDVEVIMSFEVKISLEAR
ncbi:unnamed protein product [Parnassius apollo]|uniref:(apollo) hypothetical protein n=1 Tax=Parnassius apollo TaxID=110799 RepID=A0A8S3WZH5_PARAO|nr:unnamed protein product [Parnassius apollo]